jgi:hypothetical protein
MFSTTFSRFWIISQMPRIEIMVNTRTRAIRTYDTIFFARFITAVLVLYL